MKINFKSVTLVSLFTFCFLFVIIGNRTALAAPVISGAETTANVEEVKATRTITVTSLPANGVTLTIGLCVVTFSDAGDDTDEINCNNNVAGVSRATATGGAGTARSAAQIAAVLRSLTNVSDTGHGSLTVGGSSATASFTTTDTEDTAEVITASLSAGSAITLTTVNTTGVIPVARVVTFTPSGIAVDYIYSITIDSTAYTYTHRTGTLKTIVEALKGALGSSASVTCTEDDIIITCTAAVAGTTFTFDTSTSATAVTNGTSSSGGSSGGGGGGGGSRVVAPSVALASLTPAAANELRIQNIRQQINSLLELIRRIQFRMSRMR